MTQTTYELEAYRQMVRMKALRNSTDILANAGNSHASIAMSELFNSTKKEAKMVVGSFNGAVSNQENYLRSLERCIDRDVRFEIVFLGDPNEESKAFKLLKLKKVAGKNIIFKYASKDFILQMTKDGMEKHFSVYDSNKFRFEEDSKNFLGWFSFNNKDQTLELKTIFDSVFYNLPELKADLILA